ncbi:MAG: bifunctional diaminohydroxyphosphoribosylaminopyrimidine deaminase/5-amino-6-(5-phosphoribosylamino)uracil reductase RibD [Candidatus Peribacteraceae bacterium]
MEHCLHLAEGGRGLVGDGALVGAILVRENKIIAQGCHRGFGLPHAEADLLATFHKPIKASDLLVLNLEPCCHHGKTPPCTDIIIERGVKRVCFGMFDPDSRVAGKGIEALRTAGIEVVGPVAKARCEYFNRGFVSMRTKGRPWITLKKAQTRDGKITNNDQSPLKITTEEQDIWSHTFLRARHDAILVGVETIVKDNPTLDARFAQTSSHQSGLPMNLIVILDPHLRIPQNAKVITDNDASRTIIVTASENKERRKKLTARGVRIMEVPLAGGSFNMSMLLGTLSSPSGDFHGMTSILVEGGQRTWEAFRNTGVMDEEVMLVGE